MVDCSAYNYIVIQSVEQLLEACSNIPLLFQRGELTAQVFPYSDIILEKETYVNCICTPFYTMERRSNSGFTWVITLCFKRLLNSQKLLINSRIRDYLESSKLYSKPFYFFKKLMKLFSYHWNRSSELYTLLSDIIERNT